jgi:hypothetical protein
MAACELSHLDKITGSDQMRADPTATRADGHALISGGIMRHFKKSLITLATTAAVLAPAGLAGASAQSASTPVKAATSSVDCVALCFDIKTGDVLAYNNVPVSVAANVCNTTVPVLSAFVLAQTAACAVTPTQAATITRVL